MANAPGRHSATFAVVAAGCEQRRSVDEYFAKRRGDQDLLGEVSGRAGIVTLQEYLEPSNHL